MAVLTTDGMLKVVGEFGKFQLVLDFVFCIMMIPAMMQVLIMYFAALKPGWRCVVNSTVCQYNGTLASDFNARCDMPRSEWEFVEPPEFSIVTQFDIYCDKEWMIHVTTSVLFIGWAFGAVVLGWVADNYGRKIVLFPSLGVCLFVGLASPFMPNITLFIICRFIVGFVCPGTALQMFIIISELVGGRYRPLAGNILWLFLSMTFCLLGLKAYLIREWKMLFIVCTTPYVFVLFLYKFVPESVRWLHLHGKIKEAMDIFKRIAEWNKKEIGANTLALASKKTPRKHHKSSPKDLFKNRKVGTRTSIQGYAWMVSGIVFYGLSLASDDLGGSLYLNFLLVNLVEFPATLLAIDFCDRFGRKKTVSYSMFFAGVSCVIVAFVPAHGVANIVRVVLSMIGKLCVTMSFNSIYTWSVELHSTDIRAEGMGFLQITSRVGAASAPWVAKGLKAMHVAVPFVTMGILGILSAVATMFLPETKGVEISKTEEDDDRKQKEKEMGEEENLMAFLETVIDSDDVF